MEPRSWYLSWLRSLNRREDDSRQLRRERAAVLPALAGVGILAWYVVQADPTGGPYGFLPLPVGLLLLMPLLYFYNERNHNGS